MPLLTPHDEYSMAHLIERHIEFYEEPRDGDDRTVALDPVFVRHYMKFRELETAYRHRNRHLATGAPKRDAVGDTGPRSRAGNHISAATRAARTPA